MIQKKAVETLETVRKNERKEVLKMLNFWESSLVMIIRFLEIAKIVSIVIAIALLLQLIVYQMSNKKINLYKMINKKIDYLIRF